MRTSNRPRVGVKQVALTAAFVAAALFILAWSASRLPGSVTPNYIKLFTSADPSSSRAMIEGVVWSVLLGYVTGGLAALTFNALGALKRGR